MEDAAVLIDGARILEVGPTAAASAPDEEITGPWFLVPGVVDHHVHIGLSDPRAILRGGVTAVRDLGWPPGEIFPLADISTATDFEGPAVVAAGPILTARGGYPSRAGWCPPGGWIEVRGIEDAARAVDRVAGEDPAVVKVALNTEAGPVLSDDELSTICRLAHARGLAVTAHVQGPGQTARAVEAGVDELAHAPWTERLDDELVAATARRMGMVSTLDIHSFGRDTPELQRATDNLRRFAAAGGRVRYGTDLGNGPIPPGIHAGEVGHLAAAGLSGEAILRSMTLSALRPGAEGDLVGLARSPVEDPMALGEVRLVVRGGRVRRLG